MVIKHNMAALNSERMQKIISGKLSGSSEKLASGYRINRGADDAAGLAISEKMRFQTRGLDRGSANIDEGIGYCQVADGALGEMHDMLQRMNELCIKAANGTLSASDRKYIDDEIQQLKIETDRICRMTKYNEEYIFRCDDSDATEVKEKYTLTFSGRPKDLFIYTDELNKESYAGVSFRGRRYTWDQIHPNMCNGGVPPTFQKGSYSIRADDGTTLMLNVEADGVGLPKVSRIFSTTGSAEGILVNGDLVKWDNVRDLGNTCEFSYHGMKISFNKDVDDTFEDMIQKITGITWESEYDTPVQGLALDAAFSTQQYKFNKVGEANKRIEVHVMQNKSTKYTIHAVDGNKGGTIPVWDKDGNYLGDAPFDGVWIEGKQCGLDTEQQTAHGDALGIMETG